MPAPTRTSSGEPQAGQSSLVAWSAPQWWQRSDPSRVEHERDVALLAAAGLAAVAAVERRHEPAAVQEQDRLAALPLDARELREQRRGERIAGLAAHVHDGHGRERRAEPGAELEPLEPRPALGARRRRAVEGDGALERRALGGDGARVVARVRLLLVGRVVLLVHADEPEPRHGCEDRRARPDDDGGFAGRDPLTLVATLGLAEPRVQNGDAVAEPGSKATERLRRQRDLGDEHDRAQAARDRLRARLQVHLGLAAPGGAVEQEVPTAGGDSGLDPLERGALRAAQLGRLGLAAERVVAARALLLAAARRLRRRDERERAGRRRAVVVGRPEREVDEGGRKLVEDASGRDRVDPVGRRLLQSDDDATPLRSTELHREHRPLADLVPHLVRERPRQRPGRDERIDGREAHRSSLALASALEEPASGDAPDDPSPQAD